MIHFSAYQRFCLAIGVPESIFGLYRVPQDASASAYQIMSYLLLNEEMGRRTNLLPSPDEPIFVFVFER